MTTEEFSNEFDTLVSSYRRFKDFDDKETLDSIEFNEFEKSQFLTSAQEEIVKKLYSGMLEGFESTEQNRKYLDSLIKYATFALGEPEDTPFVPRTSLKCYSVNLDEDSAASNIMYITYEAVGFNDESLGCKNGSTALVVPIRQDDLANVVKNPFRGPGTSRVIRVDTGYREQILISKYSLSTYYLGYLSKPSPIILAPLSGDLTIEGENIVQTCQLDSMLHRTILDRAVQLAMASKVITKQKE